MAKDSSGWMWLGTEDGLNRYDGYRFKVYRHNPQVPGSLSQGYVHVVHEDPAGNLWVGTGGGGLDRLRREHDDFEHYRHDPADPHSLSNDVVNSILVDRQGRLWVGTEGGLNRLDPDDNSRFIRYLSNQADPHALASNVVYGLLEDSSGTIWVGTEGGLHRFVPGRDGFVRYGHDPEDPKTLASDDVRFVYEDSLGRLWVATYGGGLQQFIPDPGQFIRYLDDPSDPNSIGSNDVNVIHEDPSSPETLWLGTRGAGLVRFDTDKDLFFRHLNDPGRPTSISNNRVSSVLIDRAGTLWAGTYDAGLNKLHRRREQFIHFTHDPDDAASLSDDYVRSIAEDASGRLWIGTYDGGVNMLGAARQRFVRFLHDPGDPTSLSSNEARNVYVDRQGIVWAGTYHGGLNRLDPASGTAQRFLHDPDDPYSLSDNRVMAILEDRHGELWVGTDLGLNRFDRRRRKFHRYVHDPKDPTSLGNNRIYTLYTDRAGTLWIGTFGGGLDRFDAEHERFSHYRHDPGNPASLSNDYILSIHEDSSGNLWIGTLGGGLDRLDRDLGTFAHFRKEDGLPSNVIHGILEEDSRFLWLSTNNGLARFEPQTGAVRVYDTGDGLLSNEFAAKAYAKTRGGELVFGNIKGLTLFHPDNLEDNPHPPPVVITAFQIFNEPVLPGPDSLLTRPIEETEAMTVSYRQSVFSFEFAALDYVAPEKNRYAYRMQGFDTDWNHVDADRRFATYTNLDPGHYVFQVRGSNSDGVWSDEAAAVAITITPPIWRTWWAYCLYVLAIGSALYAARRYEMNLIHLKNQVKLERVEAEKLKELDRAKSRFFANISHEFRTPLTLVLGPVKELIHKTSDEDVRQELRRVARNAEKVLRLINQLLDLSRLERGKLELRPTPGDLVAFLKGATMAFDSLAEQRGIGLVFHAERDSVEVAFDRDRLEEIVVNLLSNALKFTHRGGRVRLTVTASGQPQGDLEAAVEAVEIIVEDTGTGIPADVVPRIFDRFYQADASPTRQHEGTGIGLALVKELVELHCGQIEVDTEPGRGTTFVVRLPLEKSRPADVRTAPAKDTLAPETLQALDEDLPAEAEPDEAATWSESDTIVLVVEDNADLRAFMHEKLAPHYRLLEAANGAEGLEKAREAIPDLVISDVMMAKLNGYELCRALKTDQRTSHIPVILLTAKASRDDKLEGLETGADDYLTKPFDSQELLVRAANLIEQRRRLRQRFGGAVVLRPSEIAVSSIDEAFLTKALNIVEERLGDEELSVEALARELHLSRSQLHRKLSALTNQSPTLFIRSIRLQRASELLEKRAGNVAEIAYQVGFASQAYFTKCFHEQFGCTPTEYSRRKAF